MLPRGLSFCTYVEVLRIYFMPTKPAKHLELLSNAAVRH